jgi:hypothetical protein
VSCCFVNRFPIIDSPAKTVSIDVPQSPERCMESVGTTGFDEILRLIFTKSDDVRHYKLIAKVFRDD